jgi:hypothetical protein
MNSLIILGILFLWSAYLNYEGKDKARMNYLLNCPELEDVKNGIRWLRTHRIDYIRYVRMFIVYLVTVMVNLMWLGLYAEPQPPYQRDLLIVASVFVPLSFVLFFHDGAYYREYNRLLNVPHDENWYTEHRVPALVIVVGKKQRNSILLSGLGLLFLQYVALFLI